MHGSRGYLHQSVTKIAAKKNFFQRLKEANFKNKELIGFMSNTFRAIATKEADSYILKLPIIKEHLFENEKQLFFNKFQISIHNLNVYVSYRCTINKHLYHSKGYSRKGNSNSYLIYFLNEYNNGHYGEVLKYFSFQNEIYAIINRLFEDESYDLLFESNNIFKDFVNIKNFSY